MNSMIRHHRGSRRRWGRAVSSPSWAAVQLSQGLGRFARGQRPPQAQASRLAGQLGVAGKWATGPRALPHTHIKNSSAGCLHSSCLDLAGGSQAGDRRSLAQVPACPVWLGVFGGGPRSVTQGSHVGTTLYWLPCLAESPYQFPTCGNFSFVFQMKASEAQRPECEDIGGGTKDAAAGQAG